MARDHEGPKVAFQLLIYPATDYHDDGREPRIRGRLFSDATLIDYFWGHYLRGPEDGL